MNTRTKKRACAICGKKFFKHNMTFVKKSNGYICNECKHVKDYSFKLFRTIEPTDASDKLQRSIGFELETIEPTNHAILELVKRGYNATHDATCSIEFKSPIYKGTEKLVKDISFIDKLLKDKDITINNKCGTHVRIGGVNYSDIVKTQVEEAIYTLCVDPFFLWLFGRATCHYASTNINERECMINITNISKYNAIEYRLPRFRSKRRFASLLDFLVKLTDALCDRSINVYDVCYNFKCDFLRKDKDRYEFKKSNYDFYADKIANLELLTDFDVQDFVEDYIYNNFSTYFGLVELLDYTTCTLEDLMDFFDRYERLDHINKFTFLCSGNNILYVGSRNDLEEWVVNEYEDDIKSEYGNNYDVLENVDTCVETLYNDIKDGRLVYEDYIEQYTE